MKYASEDLMNEHEGILSALKVMERMTARVKTGGWVESDDLKLMIEFLCLFADKCHHGKEEELLFPAMERAGVRKEGGPIGQMILEHIEGRKLIAAMSEAFEGDSFDAGRFAAAAEEYVRLLRSHIEKENTVLFPLGNRSISEDEQKRLLGEFEAHERRVMGEGVHEQLHERLRLFMTKYDVAP